MRSLALLFVCAFATNSPTNSPTTAAPSTALPTTSLPTTALPTTAPSTVAPTRDTLEPTTSAPTNFPTGAPSSPAPTTGEPTVEPKTAAPTHSPTSPAPTAPTVPAPASVRCERALFRVLNRTYVNLEVSVAMLAASGTRLNSIGDYEGCMHVCDTAVHKCSGDVANHCTITNGLVTQGLCVPTVECTEAALQTLLAQNHLIMGHNVSFKGMKVHCGSYAEQSWSAGSIIMIIVWVLLAVLCIGGTFLDLEPQPRPQVRPLENKAGVTGTVEEALLPSPREQDVPVGKQVVLAFSLIRSVNSLLERSPTRKYKALDGIRVISLVWIILGHTLNFWLFVGLSNPNEFYPPGVTSTVSFEIFVFGAGNAVDTFFFLSAFLATLVMIRRLEKGSSVPILGSVVHRFLRLTPAYLFVIMSYIALAPHMGDGPFWYNVVSGNTAPCERYWWTNILYINNFYPKVYADQCVPWTWYLANDMQFFIVGVIFTVLFHKHFKAAAAVLFVLGVASTVITGFIVADNNIQAVSIADPSRYQNDVYDKPYTRIPSYFIGMFVAFLFTKTSVRIKGPTWTGVCIFFMFVCTFVPCYAIHGEFNPLSGWDTTKNVLYLTLSRPCWTIGVALLTYLCICDVGGVFNWILSLGLWDPLAKLSYAAYLVHPIIMRVFYFNKRSLFFWSPWEYATYFVANLVISYAVAMIVYCAVETPFASLEKVVGSLGKRGKREKR